MSRFGQYLELGVGVLDRVVRPKISKVTIPITYDCNQRCKTCDIWRVNREDPELKSREITLEEFRKFLEVNNLLWVAHSGGESFIRQDMGDILLESLRSCRLVSVTTNGSSCKKISEDIRYALAYPGNSTLAVNVSFNGPERIHDGIAGIEGSYQRALTTYRALREIGSSRLRVGISYTTSCLNQGKFGEFIEGMKSEFPGVGGITYGIGQEADYYCWKDRKEVPPTKLEVKEFATWVCKDYPKGFNPFNWVSYKYLDGLRNGKGPPKCVAGQYSLMLDPYWNVYPCMFFCPTNPIGNLREVGFDLKKNIDYKKCRELVSNCKGCWTPCEAYPTIVFRPWRVL